MRSAKTVVPALLGLALLWSAPSAADSDGWYKWEVEGATTALYVLKKNDQPVRIRVFNPDCQTWGHKTRGIDGEVTDMGTLSLNDSVTMLLDIARSNDMDMRVREDALFWLAQSDSDAAYAYINELLFDS